MKTAEDLIKDLRALKKQIVGFSSSVSADKGFSNKKWLGSAHIYQHNAAKHC